MPQVADRVGDETESPGEGAAPRFEFAEEFESQPPSSAHKRSQSDLDMVEGLLARCWREVDASELNIKMTDIVRLLEFKNKLSPAIEAERSFWAMVDQMRKDELAGYGDLSGMSERHIVTEPRLEMQNEPVDATA